MKTKIKNILLTLILCITLQGIKAEKIYAVDDVPNLFAIKDKSIYDPEHQLSDRNTNRLRQQMQYLKDELHIDGAIVLLPEIKETTLTSDFTEELYKKWNTENGKSILFVVIYGNAEHFSLQRRYNEQQRILSNNQSLPWGQRKISASEFRMQKSEACIVVSKSFEKEIPNILRFKIEEEVESQKTWGVGLVKGVKHLTYLLKNENARVAFIQKLEKEEQEAYELGLLICNIIALLFALVLAYRGYQDYKKFNVSNPYIRSIKWEYPVWLIGFPMILFSILFLPITLVFLIIWWFLKRKNTRLTCEKCGGHKVKRMNYDKIKDPEIKKKAYDTFPFRCKTCEHIHYEEEKVYNI